MHKISMRSPALRRARLLSLNVVIGTMFIGSPAASAFAETPSFYDLLQQAQINAPQLLEQTANVRAAQADARQARAWSNPTLNATAENLGAPASGGLSQRQDTYTLTQVFEVGGKRSARIAAEQKKSVAVVARELLARVSFANGLAVAYATAEAMQLRKDVADAELLRARDDLRAAQALVRAGREAVLRLLQARASAASAEAAVQSTSADAFEALERLSALVGSPQAFTRIDHSLLMLAADPRAIAVRASKDTPALAAAIAERDAVSAQVLVEEKRWFPDIGVSIGLRKFGGTTDTAKTLALTASIPLFDHNDSGISAARERANAAAMRAEAARLDVIASHRVAAAQLQASALRLQATLQGEEAAIEAYRVGRIGYDAGKTALLELLAIRRALSDAKLLTIEARLAQLRAVANLSTAEGRIAFEEKS